MTTCSNVDSEATMEPPIQEEGSIAGSTLSLGGPGGRRAVTSLCTRSGNPGNIVLPPERAMVAHTS